MSTGWTVDEAAEQLHPPLSAAEVRALILVCAIPALGNRSGGRGRPAVEYDQAIILRAHAAVVTIRPGTRPTFTEDERIPP
ncbi:hypothetical protein ACLQ2R_03270 [Streptosporangium sp. DT93]|uniref:hypothetical protein n=1 Tax=Streptosporangium sp. DT93 TaxID=3393428 RepID=UPI003CEE5EF0